MILSNKKGVIRTQMSAHNRILNNILKEKIKIDKTTKISGINEEKISRDYEKKINN